VDNILSAIECRNVLKIIQFPLGVNSTEFVGFSSFLPSAIRRGIVPHKESQEPKGEKKKGGGDVRATSSSSSSPKQEKVGRSQKSWEKRKKRKMTVSIWLAKQLLPCQQQPDF
jgi:hypothetical protein